MRRLVVLLAAALALPQAGLAAAPAQKAKNPSPPKELPALSSPIAFSKDETAKLHAGKAILKDAPDFPLQKTSDNSWVAAALVPQDAEAAAGLLLDFQKQPEIFSKLKDIAVTPLGESRYRIVSTVQAGWFSFRYTTLWEYDAKEQLAAFSLDTSEENDFEEYRGYWKFIPQPDGKTLILYSIRTKTKNNPFSFIEDAESRKEMPKTLEEFKTALAAAAEKPETKTKEGYVPLFRSQE